MDTLSPPAADPVNKFEGCLDFAIAMSFAYAPDLLGAPSWLLSAITGLTGVSWNTAWGFVALSYEILSGTAILLFVLRWEERPLASIGITRLQIRHVYGIAVVFVACALIDRWWGSLLTTLIPVAHPSLNLDRGIVLVDDQLGPWFLPPVLRLGVIVCGGFAEELTFRAYSVERLTALTNSIWPSALVALVADLAAHVPAWGLRGAVFLAPGQAVFLAFYVWRRNLFASTAAHVAVNCYLLF